MLADTYLEGNKVLANMYRSKKMILPVSMKLKKFHTCSNHYILYRGKYENLQSCTHCGASRYKRNNAGCRADVDDEGPKSRQKKNKTTKQIPVVPKDEEEVGYEQRKSLALSVWCLPMIDRLRALFGNPEDAKLMSWHALAKCINGDGKL